MSDDDIAMDEDGRRMSLPPDQVRAMVERAMREGRVEAIVTRTETGEYAVAFIGGPSEELLGVFEQACAAIRLAMKGH
jgi:hypothetical protein